MQKKFDKLGRKIPVFDRSAAAVKANKTSKEKYGPDHHKRIGAIGGSHSTRGYFGSLKDQGKTEELKTIAKNAAAESAKTRSAKGYKNPLKKEQGNTPLSGGV